MICARVEDGSFETAGDVITAALKALKRVEDAERLHAIQGSIKAAIDNDSPGIPLEEAFDRVTKHIQKLAVERNDPTLARQL